MVAHRAARNFFRHDPSQVEDAVAETMTRVLERWERVRRHDNPDGWVVVCAKNVCLEQIRKITKNLRSSAREPGFVVDITDEIATAEVISLALAKLTKRQRDVAVLRYMMDYDESTTAEMLRMTPARVK